MSNESHAKAPQHRDQAAAAHRDDADHPRRGDAKAHGHSTNAQAHSKKGHAAPGMAQSKAKDPASRR
jgi:hypothetical protein